MIHLNDVKPSNTCKYIEIPRYNAVFENDMVRTETALWPFAKKI